MFNTFKSVCCFTSPHREGGQEKLSALLASAKSLGSDRRRWAGMLSMASSLLCLEDSKDDMATLDIVLRGGGGGIKFNAKRIGNQPQSEVESERSEAWAGLRLGDEWSTRTSYVCYTLLLFLDQPFASRKEQIWRSSCFDAVCNPLTWQSGLEIFNKNDYSSSLFATFGQDTLSLSYI